MDGRKNTKINATSEMNRLFFLRAEYNLHIDAPISKQLVQTVIKFFDSDLESHGGRPRSLTAKGEKAPYFVCGDEMQTEGFQRRVRREELWECQRVCQGAINLM
jgi:hypothetical protein